MKDIRIVKIRRNISRNIELIIKRQYNYWLVSFLMNECQPQLGKVSKKYPLDFRYTSRRQSNMGIFLFVTSPDANYYYYIFFLNSNAIFFYIYRRKYIYKGSCYV